MLILMQSNNSIQTSVLACYSWADFWRNSSNVSTRPHEHRWTMCPILMDNFSRHWRKDYRAKSCVLPQKNVSPTIRSMFGAWEIKQTTNKQQKALWEKAWCTPRTYLFCFLLCWSALLHTRECREKVSVSLDALSHFLVLPLTRHRISRQNFTVKWLSSP